MSLLQLVAMLDSLTCERWDSISFEVSPKADGETADEMMGLPHVKMVKVAVIKATDTEEFTWKV